MISYLQTCVRQISVFLASAWEEFFVFRVIFVTLHPFMRSFCQRLEADLMKGDATLCAYVCLISWLCIICFFRFSELTLIDKRASTRTWNAKKKTSLIDHHHHHQLRHPHNEVWSQDRCAAGHLTIFPPHIWDEGREEIRSCVTCLRQADLVDTICFQFKTQSKSWNSKVLFDHRPLISILAAGFNLGSSPLRDTVTWPHRQHA